MGKVTVYLDDETWTSFKRKVLRKTGSLRRISEELRAIVQDSLVEETLVTAFKDLGYDIMTFPSAAAIVAVRPRRRTSSAEVTRELREKRHGPALSRH